MSNSTIAWNSLRLPAGMAFLAQLELSKDTFSCEITSQTLPFLIHLSELLKANGDTLLIRINDNIWLAQRLSYIIDPNEDAKTTVILSKPAIVE